MDHDPEMRRAELAFLRHLADAGLNVQRPIADATLSDGTQATLLTWLEGHHITEAEFTPDMHRQIGVMVARLHQAAQGFHYDAMRRYDAAHVARLAETLRQMGERHRLNMDEIDVACQAARVIKLRLARFPMLSSPSTATYPRTISY